MYILKVVCFGLLSAYGVQNLGLIYLSLCAQSCPDTQEALIRVPC